MMLGPGAVPGQARKLGNSASATLILSDALS
jgi:hypothetical protein